MKKNKLILFDWGNIVESHTKGYNIYDAFDDTFKSLGYTENNIFSKLGKYKLSSIPTMNDLENTYNEIKRDFNLNSDFKTFLEKYKYYSDKIYYFTDVRDYEVSLKGKCYIGIFSNLMVIDKERLDKEVGLSNYDYVFLSFEMNAQKPNLDAFEKVQSTLSLKKEDILFIDDREKNILAARNFGWNAFQATSNDLEKIKTKCNNFINS